jgi:hypothetical protein
MKVDVLQNFFTGTPPTGQMSVRIRCSTDGADPFQVTLFVGNDQGGFGFQTTTSWDYTYTTGVIFDPFLPIDIPKLPVIPMLPVM